MNTNELNLPEQWREVGHYDLRIAWLHNQPQAHTLEFQQIMEEHGKKISLEVAGHSGWWLYSNVLFGSSFDVLEEALALAKSTLKNSDLAASALSFDVLPGSSAPVRLSKSQRIKLIDQIMHEPKYELLEGIVREAFFQLEDYALSVRIEDVPYREEFEAMFAAPENPLRSLEGEICTVYTSVLDEDLEDEDLDDFDMDDDFDEGLEDSDMDDLDEEEKKEFREFLEALEKGETPKLPSMLKPEFTESDEAEDLDELEELDELEDLDDLDDLEDDEDEMLEDGDWQEVAKGVVRLEGNTLHVGDWSCTVPENELVYGTAFMQASFDLKETKQTILIEKENTHE